MRCPRCGSYAIERIIRTDTTEKGFGFFKACCGYLIFGCIGILCGLCGAGKRRTFTTTSFICRDCGHRF